MGKFRGLEDLETDWPLPLRNKVILNNEISYEDDHEMLWIAPSGLHSDGKTVPPIFWIIVGTPLAPETLPAALVHDNYCNNRLRPYKDVHHVFGEMLRDLKIPWFRRNLMTWAVRNFGPRWPTNDNSVL